MSNFKQKLAHFFYGRYGSDNFYNFLFATELILLVAGAVCNILGRVAFGFAIASFVLYPLALLTFAYAMFRFFSRNISKRQKENQRYLRIKFKVLHPIKSHRPSRPYDTVTHVFRNCPKCKSVLRLPREIGKHTVKCPQCSERFTVKIKK